ncbi:hypothetical protein ACIPY6_38645 [Streptomyces sp. NPDC090054]|uniref:hypothetical protein n=1 Tax=Streptomyces sp. NPDC090054 TaxID=3365933 RepID=UPI0037F40C66
MLSETSGRNAQDLAAELEGLRGVDWASIWQGPPQGGSSECRGWCERYGWEPQTADRNLVVSSKAGGRWTFEANGNWDPVFRLTHWAWRLSADEASENPGLLTRAADEWPEFLKAAENVLGPAAWNGPWDAPDFPEPPEAAFWEDREYRLETRTPYRMAYWKPVGEHPGQAVIVLVQSVSFAAWTSAMPGSSLLRLTVHATEGSRRSRV